MGFLNDLFGFTGLVDSGDSRSLNNPNIPLNDANIFANYDGPSNSVTVTEALAMSIPAVARSLTVISDTIAGIPINVVDNSGDFPDPVSMPDLEYLLDVEPNSELYGKISFYNAIIRNLLLYGNAYCIIHRRNGQVKYLKIIHPSEMDVYEKNDRVFYKVEDSNRDHYRADEVLHFKQSTVDGILGISTLVEFQDLFNLAIGILEYSSHYFKNGAFLAGVLEAPQSLSPEAVKRLQRGLNKFRGSQNSNKILVLESGTRYAAVSDDPNKSRYIESMEMVNSEIARVFGVPPFLLNDLSKSTMQNVESLTLSFLSTTIQGITDCLSEEMSRKLLTEADKRSGLRVNFNVNSVIRKDSKTRAEWIKTSLGTGLGTINEMRAIEGMRPIEGGDETLVPMNYQTLTNALKNNADEPIRNTSGDNGTNI